MRALHLPRPLKPVAPWPVPDHDHAPKIMSAAPAMTISNSATLPRSWPIGSANASYAVPAFVNGGTFSISRTLPKADPVSTQAFNAELTITQDSAGTQAGGTAQISFYHEGESLELGFHSDVDGFLVRIDGEYPALEPIRMAGSFPFALFEFGERRRRRIDLFVYKTPFIEARTGPNDSLWAAPIRGPRTICVGDSFSQPAVNSWIHWFAEAMGWDDVWASGVGGTGFVKTVDGTKQNFRQRVQADVIAFRPQLVFVHGSVNDLGEDIAALRANSEDFVRQVHRALPECIVAGGMNTPFGIEYWTADMLDHADALREGLEAGGAAWISPIELPIARRGTAPGGNVQLLDAIVAGKAGNTGDPTQVDAFTGFRIASDMANPAANLRLGATVEIGTGATRERKVLTAYTRVGGKQVFGFDGSFRYDHPAGEPVREVGPCMVTGLGNSAVPKGWGNADLYVGGDQYHPGAAGRLALGQCNAAMLKDHLRAIGRA